MQLTKTMARRKATHTSSSTVMSRCKAISDGTSTFGSSSAVLATAIVHIIAPAMHANTAAFIAGCTPP
nr:hypothetical protein Itr_chr09CG07040 [Ipomoea trifida]